MRFALIIVSFGTRTYWLSKVFKATESKSMDCTVPIMPEISMMSPILKARSVITNKPEITFDTDVCAAKPMVISAIPAGTEQAEGFIITVCNLDYIKQVIAQQGFFDGRWHVVMENPTKDNIIKYLQRILPCEYFKDWTEAYQKLRLIGRSEFEDYKECP